MRFPLVFLQKYIVRGKSMEPELKNGQTVFISGIPYLFRKPKNGDIVVAFVQNKELIKRIKNVHQNVVTLIGDNKNKSTDSRTFGDVFIQCIIGKVVYRL